MRRAAFVLAVLLSAAPALAGEKAGDPGTHVEMPYLIAPLMVDDKLYGYAYISPQVVTASRNASLEVREKIAFIQDAYVRDVNATPVGKAGDPKAVDTKAVIARLLADTRRIVGGGKVVDVVLLNVQVTPLRQDEALPAKPPEG